MWMNRKRLYRCRYDRQIAGVAGGIAEYFEIDPTVVRLVWIVSVFFGGFTLLLYILMAFIVPLEPVGYGLAPRSMGPMGPNGPVGPIAPGSTSGVAGAGDPPAGTGIEGEPAGVPGLTAAGADAHAAYWATQADAAAIAPHRHAGGGTGGSLLTIFGVALVVFGGLALLGPIVPGWVAGIHLGPAFLLALGIALLVASIRRSDPDRVPDA
jgi:phage shock protein C